MIFLVDFILIHFIHITFNISYATILVDSVDYIMINGNITWHNLYNL